MFFCRHCGKKSGPARRIHFSRPSGRECSVFKDGLICQICAINDFEKRLQILLNEELLKQDLTGRIISVDWEHLYLLYEGARRGNENHIPQANDMLFVLKALDILSPERRANWMVEYDRVNIGFCSFVGSFTPLYFNRENDARSFAEVFLQRDHPFHLNRL